MKSLNRISHTICLLLLISSLGLAQRSVRTNVWMPIMHTIDSENYGFGLSVNYEFQVNPRGVVRLGFHHQKQIISNAEPDPIAIASETSYDVISKAGFRAGYKRYYRENSESILPRGLYIGAFTDLMFAHRVLTKKIYSQESGYNENTAIDKAGLFFGGGISAGYTFMFGQLVVEPNFGIGLCFNPKSFYNENSTGLFSELAPLSLHLSVWHIELNVGWAF